MKKINLFQNNRIIHIHQKTSLSSRKIQSYIETSIKFDFLKNITLCKGSFKSFGSSEKLLFFLITTSNNALNK